MSKVEVDKVVRLFNEYFHLNIDIPGSDGLYLIITDDGEVKMRNNPTQLLCD